MKIPVLLRPVALGAHLFGFFCVAVAVSLGFWQLGSWENQREQAAEVQADLPPVPLDDALGPDDPFPKSSVGRTVSVVGTWLPDSTMYVADRERHGETGHWVITPVAVTGGDDVDPSTVSALLVVRGWTASIDPRPVVPEGEVALTAWLQPAEGTPGLVDDDRTDDVIPQVRMGDALQRVDQDLYGGYAVVRPAAGQVDESGDLGTAGLEQVDLDQVPEVAATTGWRNLLYAVEWWIFAGFAAFIWIRWCRDELNPEREGDAADTTVGGTPSDADRLESAG